MCWQWIFHFLAVYFLVFLAPGLIQKPVVNYDLGKSRVTSSARLPNFLKINLQYYFYTFVKLFFHRWESQMLCFQFKNYSCNVYYKWWNLFGKKKFAMLQTNLDALLICQFTTRHKLVQASECGLGLFFSLFLFPFLATDF
jgi:hypothetical protein